MEVTLLAFQEIACGMLRKSNFDANSVNRVIHNTRGTPSVPGLTWKSPS